MPVTGLSIGEKILGTQELWRPLLLEWSIVLDQFALVSGSDLAQWHAERPNIGFLAAAAWRLGRKACAVEEYREDWKPNVRGRPDLWIRVGDQDVCVEAKRHSIRGASASDMEKARIKLEAAAGQVRKRGRRQARQGMAICFLGIRVERSRPNREVEQIDEITRQLMRTFSNPKNIVCVSQLQDEIRLERRKKRPILAFVPAGMALVGKQVWAKP